MIVSGNEILLIHRIELKHLCVHARSPSERAAIFGSMPCVHIIRYQMRYSSFHLPSDDINYALLPIVIDTEELALGLGLVLK